MTLRRFACPTALIVLVCAAQAQTTRRVPEDHATIQAAISASVDGDTVLVAPGTYVERLQFLGKAITVESAAGAAVTVIDAASLGTVVSFGVGLTPVEGPDSILRGFTLTRGANFTDGGGISARRGATPRIQACIVRGNANVTGGGGVKGPAILEDCTLDFNTSDDEGGAFAGGPTLLRCLVRGNSAEFFGGAGVGGSGTLLVSCTVVDNYVRDSRGGGGGIVGQATLVNCILWNERGELDPLAATASYCLVQGGFPGTGNVSGDPLFRDDHPGVGDYRLLPGSPAIDAGDPAAPLDPDGTRADMGALPFTHATVFALNGSGTNPLLLAALNAPAIGTSWQATIQAALVPGPLTSGLQVRSGARAVPLATPFGEYLLAGALLGSAQTPSNGTLDAFSFALPADSALLGLTVHAQGYVLGTGGPTLGNGLSLLVGE